MTKDILSSTTLGRILRKKLLQAIPTLPAALKRARNIHEIAEALIRDYGDGFKLQRALKKRGLSIEKIAKDARKERKSSSSGGKPLEEDLWKAWGCTTSKPNTHTSPWKEK